VAGKELII